MAQQVNLAAASRSQTGTGAARAVGNIMREAHEPGLPYHRVIAAGGRLGGYGGQEGLKQALLRQEGVPVSKGRVREFHQRRWPDRQHS